MLTTTTRALCLSALVIAGPARVMAQAPPTDAVTVHVGAASRAAQAFSRSHSIADLRPAIDEMVSAGNLPGFKPDTFVAQRRTFVRGWAQVLKVIEQSYDPTYDPNDRNNWPAWGFGDPQYIKDPQMQAAAVAALAANDQKVKRMAFYHDRRVLDMLAQATLKVQLDQLRRVAPDGTDADFAELDAILQQAGLSSALRTKINAMFYARPGG
jgi:hypothetical protein